MAKATGEAKPSPLRLTFDRRVQLEFHGARITLQTTVTEEQPDEPAADEAEEFEEPRRPPRLRLLNPETVRLCNRYQVPSMPGAMTIREVIDAMEAGADIVKLFPGEAFGPGIIKAIKGPLPQAPLMPTGGVDLSNVAERIKAGAVAVGACGSLTGGAKTGDFASVTRTAREFVEKIREARGR